MRIATVADGRSITLNLTRNEARDLRDHLNRADWNSLDDTSKTLFHFLDMTLAPARRPAVPTFPGGGI